MLKTIFLKLRELILGKPKLTNDDCYITFIWLDDKVVIEADSRATIEGMYTATKCGYLLKRLEEELSIKSKAPDIHETDNLHYPPSQFYSILNDEEKE
jgi:hypothetical protein